MISLDFGGEIFSSGYVMKDQPFVQISVSAREISSAQITFTSINSTGEAFFAKKSVFRCMQHLRNKF